jgi:hypothetical protein
VDNLDLPKFSHKDDGNVYPDENAARCYDLGNRPNSATNPVALGAAAAGTGVVRRVGRVRHLGTFVLAPSRGSRHVPRDAS